MATNPHFEGEPVPAVPDFKTKHYSVLEISELWQLSPQFVRELFEKEDGVIVKDSKGAYSKRRHRTLRIPESVMERVHRRLSKKF